MIIARTPFRISFFGGGTDYPAWYKEYGGAVLGTTIDKYCYITCRWRPAFFEDKHRIVYSQTETVQEIDEVKHPSVRETLRFMKITEGVEIHYDADLPTRTGIGSSSSFTVGLLHALYALKGIMPTKMQLAIEAIHIEQNMIRESVGSQDQTLAAFGGFNRIDFNNGINITPITVNSELLQSHLMLFFTGLSRTASQIAERLIQDIPRKKEELVKMQQMVDEGLKILNRSDIAGFGRLLHENWQLKRGLTDGISTDYIDYLYERALKAGAMGGKLCGAGGGGFLLLFVPPEAQDRVRQELKLLEVPFTFEHSGSQIVFYEGG